MRVPTHRISGSAFDNETMTPMIDVVFLLLVFFVCASIGSTPEKLLPASLGTGVSKAPIRQNAEPEPVFDHQQVRIRVLRTADTGSLRILLNEQPVGNHQELEQKLTALVTIDAKSPVVIDVADDVEMQQFITVYDLCQRLKFESINLAAKTSGR
ncbi:MAG: biopolymer transporter ExbD [Planctomyces sp.]|nr:biopolymer transporter ExbD [Planctomyces sp.]